MNSRPRHRHPRRPLIVTVLAAVGLLVAAAPAAAETFGLNDFDVTFKSADGEAATQAGSHPFAMTTFFNVNDETTSKGIFPAEPIKDLVLSQVPGFVGDQTAVPTCSTLDFLTKKAPSLPNCANSSAVGVAEIFVGEGGGKGPVQTPVWFLQPSPGKVAKLGFWAQGIPVSIDLSLSEAPPYEIVATSSNTTQVLEVFSVEFTLWGVPGDPIHDAERGTCVKTGGSCSSGDSVVPFLTLPRACSGPLRTSYGTDSWMHPGDWVFGGSETHDTAGNPQGLTGCGRLAFGPTITAQPTSEAVQSPTGLDFSLDVKDEGLENPAGISQSDIRKVEVTLPEGFSTNPSIAEGLSTCSEADLARETAASAPGAGCPDASKIGTVEVESPLLAEGVNGSLFIATPYQNPFHSLLALYIVIKNRQQGILVRQPLEVLPDQATGRLTTIAEELPQLPFSHFRLHFREGTRSPLVTPPLCGEYDADATLYPSSGGSPVTTSSAFSIISGPNGFPCPSGGTPPFRPGLIAGSINNAAGAFSPFNVRLFRSDSEQEFTHFSIKLPPGVTGKLAGIPFCSDRQIAAAVSRERTAHGGQEEIERPSCPQASEVGRTLVGAGVGPALTYVPGKVYLAGPYHGDSLSIVAITSGVVGPFDVGTVVIREALEVNPETAEVFVDATGSDPIPHIVNGIPVHARDIRVYVDRPDFVLNPTSCTPTSTASTVLGSGADFASEADDRPVTVTTRFQAADCANLGYRPRLQLKLKGSSKRGGNPALTAILRPRPGDANSKRISVALPHSEFLAQAHIKTICTRVQFKAGGGNGEQCPPGSVYGHAKAWTPLLSEPLQGPVFLRSSEHPLPDMVLALHGLIDFDAVGRIDSVNGGIRNTFDTVPDAPITKVELKLGGGKKSLLENSTNLCKGKHKATAKYAAQNGRKDNYKLPLQVQCKQHKKAKKHGRRGSQGSPARGK